MDDRGVAGHAADAVELLDNAVVLNSKVRHRGVGRGERGEEVGDLADVVFGGGGLHHDLGVEARAGDDDEAVALLVAVLVEPKELAHVHFDRATGAASLGKRRCLGGITDVVKEQAGCARGENERGDTAPAHLVEHVGDGAVAARNDHAIEFAHVRHGILGFHTIADKTHHDLVAALREGVRECVDFI